MGVLSLTQSFRSGQSYWLNEIKHEKSQQLSNMKNERSQGLPTLRKMIAAPTGPSKQPIDNPLQEEHADGSLSRKRQALEEITINAKCP